MTHTKIALGTSFILWFFFFLAVFFIPLPVPPEEKQEFGEVAIRLDPLPKKVVAVPPTPIEQSVTEESVIDQVATTPQATVAVTPSEPAEASAPQESAPSIPSAPAEVAIPKQETLQKTEQIVPAKSTTPAPIEPTTPPPQQKLAKTTAELIAEQAAATRNKPEPVWDDSIFADSSSTSSVAQNNVVSKPQENSSALAGSAASANVTSSSNKTVAEGTSVAQTTRANNAVSKETTDLLGSIGAIGEGSEGVPSSSESDGILASTSGSTQGISNGLAISFEGENRKLLRPAVPSLAISQENQKLIDSSRKITISFNVSASGNVSSIVFTPSSLLPPAIQSELREQISKWQFAPGSSSGQARFIYSINKG